MRGDPGVIDYLNKGLRHELTAVNQYWLHYRLLDNWGYKSLAKQWRKESIEEMEHADKLIERIIFLDGFPNMQVLDPLHIGQTVKEVLECDLRAEMSARALYEEAATHCHAVKDYVSRDLFEKLMHDEEEHIDFLETQLDLVAKLGARALCPTSHRQAGRRQGLTRPTAHRVPRAPQSSLTKRNHFGRGGAILRRFADVARCRINCVPAKANNYG